MTVVRRKIISEQLYPWLTLPLLPLSWLYAVCLTIYLLPYKIGIRKRRRLPCRVVSIGNITFGGTGKSPTVRTICEGLISRGIKPAILSRGHGGRLSSTGAIVSNGKKRLLDAHDCGDEPALLADALPGVPVGIGKDRWNVGMMLIEQFNPDIILLDDGMQYWQLYRDLEIVLVRADRPFGMGRVLPAGDLREPISGLKRSDAIIITGSEIVSPECIEKLRMRVKALAPRAEIFIGSKTSVDIVKSADGGNLSKAMLNGMPVVAVSGIASPESFETLLAQTGADVRESVRFGDHCAYSGREVELILNTVRRTGAQSVVTTAKDAVKLRLSNMYVLDIDLIIEDSSRLLDLVVGEF